jgi:hypothetical protein
MQIKLIPFEENGGANKDDTGNMKGYIYHVSIKQPYLVRFTSMHPFVFLPAYIFYTFCRVFFYKQFIKK